MGVDTHKEVRVVGAVFDATETVFLGGRRRTAGLKGSSGSRLGTPHPMRRGLIQTGSVGRAAANVAWAGMLLRKPVRSSGSSMRAAKSSR